MQGLAGERFRKNTAKPSVMLESAKTDINLDLGEQMYAFCKELFPICRSITGQGFRTSLKMLNSAMGGGSSFIV